MKKQKITFELDKELSKKAESKIINILLKERANNIVISFVKKRGTR